MTEILVVCSKCGTINRLPPSRPAIDAKCGKCKTKVFAGHPEDVAAEISTARSRAAPSRFSSMSGHLGADLAA